MKKLVSLMLIFVCIFSFGIALSGCRKRTGWQAPQRIVLKLPNKLHVEYQNNSFKGDALLPGYCVLVKEGNLYYVKTPHKYYHYNRLEVFVKTDLKKAVEFAGPNYGQGHISACWNDYTNSWQTADQETDYEWQANDQNGSVYYTGIGFLDSGYGDVNHTYENGVADRNGYKFTATQKDNETVTLASGQTVECVVWEYEAWFSDDNWGKEKFWFEATTGITIKRTYVSPSSTSQSLDDDSNIGLVATYFATNETMQSYLSKVGVDRWPAPDFSSYK